MPQTGEQRAESGRYSGIRFLPLIPIATDGANDSMDEMDLSDYARPVKDTQRPSDSTREGFREPHVDSPQPNFDEPFLHLQPSEEADIGRILEPVQDALAWLRATTLQKMPEYNPHVRIKSHAQVLRARLVAIGKFVAQYLGQSVPESRRGIAELQI
jgi:hypothetical protein